MTPVKTDPSNSSAPRSAGAWRRRFLIGGALAATFAAGALASTVAPAVTGAAAGVAAQPMGPGFAQGMMAAHLSRMLASVGASSDQSARIHTIMASAMGSLRQIHARAAANHQELHTLLTSPTIDRAAIERIRAKSVTDFDQSSHILTDAMADVAQVLTPQQRAKIGAEMAGHHHMGAWRHGL
jgi:Spy/CpxP family protein refolding chaperone